MKIIELKVLNPATGERIVHLNSELIESIEPGNYLGDPACEITMCSGTTHYSASSLEHVLGLIDKATCSHPHP